MASRVSRLLRKPALDWKAIGFSALMPTLAVLAALLIGAVMLVLLKANPFEAYAAMIGGALGDVSGLTQSLVKATPLLLVGLGIVIAFRASVINIGGEGQIIVGALMATWFSLTFRAWPAWLLVTATLLMGFAAGAMWGFVPGFLKARLGVNEILSTVMMNAIALQLMNALLSGPLIDPAGVAAGTFLAQSERLPENVWLPRLVPQTLLHTGALIALALAVAVYIFLWRTTIGYRIRAVGANPRASRYAGISVERYQLLAFLLSGALAGLGGAVELYGVTHRLFSDGSAHGFTGNAGFNGIVAALFGGLHPIGTIPASILFGALLVGANQLQRTIQVPSAFVVTLDGLIVVFVVASQIWAQRRVVRAPEEKMLPAHTANLANEK